MKFKFTPKKIAFILVMAVLAWYLMNLDIQDAERKISFQRTQLIHGECMYFDGFQECPVDQQYCNKDGQIAPFSFGFCEELSLPSYNRAALGDECDTDDDCEDDEYCVDDACSECRRDSQCTDSDEPYCYNNACVECEEDDNCDDGQVCVENSCAAAASSSTDECETTSDCDDDEYCDDGDCISADRPEAWSTADVDDEVLNELEEDWKDLIDKIDISKKWLWYSLFFVGILISLGLLIPPKKA